MTNQTSRKPIDGIRRTVRGRLPKLLRKAIADYVAFAAQPAPDDAKGFAAHQAACKAALAHLDAGAKLLGWAEEPGASTSDADNLARMIRAAEEAVAATDPDDI